MVFESKTRWLGPVAGAGLLVACGPPGHSDFDGGATGGAVDATTTDGPDPGDTTMSPKEVDCLDGSGLRAAADHFVDVADLQQRIVDTTCSPQANACHAGEEYPGLDAADALQALIGAPCWHDGPDSFDGCELPGDRLTFGPGGNEGFVTELASTRLSGGDLVLTVRAPPPASMGQPHVVETVAVSRVEIDGSSRYLGSFTSAVEYAAGDTELRIHEVLIEVADQVLWTRLREGDANGNGVFGGDFGPYAMIWPGDPDRSYLLARVRGAFPGHAMMPMANDPLTPDELAALTCWIDGLVPGDPDSAAAPIDYCACDVMP